MNVIHVDKKIIQLSVGTSKASNYIIYVFIPTQEFLVKVIFMDSFLYLAGMKGFCYFRYNYRAFFVRFEVVFNYVDSFRNRFAREQVRYINLASITMQI